MSQPVKLSDSLVLDARLAGQAFERSISGQVEFWSRLGRAVESLLRGDQALALVRSGAVRPLSECLESVDTDAGRRRLDAFLAAQPGPRYEPAPGAPKLLVRIEADGTHTVGRFVNRKFVARKKVPRRPSR